MAPKIDENWFKIRSGADLGRLILRFWVFWTTSKNQCFLVPVWWLQKSEKIGPRSAWEAPPRPTGSPRVSFQAAWGPGAAARTTRYQGTKGLGTKVLKDNRYEVPKY